MGWSRDATSSHWRFCSNGWHWPIGLRAMLISFWPIFSALPIKTASYKYFHISTSHPALRGSCCSYYNFYFEGDWIWLFFLVCSCCSVVQSSCSQVMRPLPFPWGWGCYLIPKRCIASWDQLTANHAQITFQTFNCNTSMLKSQNWLWKICNLFKWHSPLTQNSQYNRAVCILKTFENGCLKMALIYRIFYFLKSATLYMQQIMKISCAMCLFTCIAHNIIGRRGNLEVIFISWMAPVTK